MIKETLQNRLQNAYKSGSALQNKISGRSFNDASRCVKAFINLSEVDSAVQIWTRSNMWILFFSHLSSFQVQCLLRQPLLADDQSLAMHVT